MLTKILPVEENVCNFKEGSSNMDPNAAVENLSVSLQSCEPFGVPDNDSPKVFIAPDILGTDVLLGAFNSISIVESSGRREHEGKDNVTFDDASETKCPDIIYPSPRRRSTRTNKSNRKTQTKKAAGKRRKTANKKPLLDLILLKVARRRRSVLCKRARSSLWGLLGNVTQVFEQNIGLDVNQNEYKKSRKERSGRGSGKRNKNQAGRSSQRSKGKTCASASGIRLKVKLRKEVDQIGLMDMVPVIENGPERYWGTSIEFPKLDNDVEGKLEGEVPGIGGFQGCNGNPEKRLMLSDASVLDVHLTDKDPNSTLVAEKLAGITADNHHAIPCQIEFEGVGVAVDHTYLDPGTSPDSEVINLIPDGQFSGKVQVQVQEDLQDILISSQASVTPRDITSSNPQTSSKKGKKKGKFPRVFNCIVEDILPSPEIINDTRIFEEPGQREKMGDGFYSSEASISITAGNTSGNTSSSEGFSREPLPSSGVTDFGVSCGTLKVESGAEVDLYSKLGVGLDSPASMISEKLLPYSTSKGCRLAKNSKSKGVYKGGPELPDSAGSRRGKACRKKGSQTKLVNKKKIKEKVDCEQVVCKVESLAETDDRGETKTGDRSTTEGVLNLGVVLGGIGEQCLPRRSAWVRCDDCYNWRRIPATLADSIEETNCKWICKDNTDKAFADCSTPQEKSNAEINAELEISDASCEEDACDARLNSKRLEQKHLIVPQQSSWMLIKSNLFLHRSRKTQTIDEIMVCHCKPPVYGQMGCGDGCLNRMLNIECVQGTCPCGEFCSNQQFHKGNYAKLRWFRCGKKGYGLQLLENISRGQFLIEYVGEVLHMHAYEERQREYALKGHKHFYFMTLNGSEVIDACAKGNLGRFINHSCDPNCRTEKWMVNGEVCIGLFALRDIKKGEEVTFDYNYVRVFGAAAKKCVCGSSQCQGYIGGDPLNTEVIVQGDSDEEYPEPVMLYKDGEIDEDLRNLIPALDSCDGTEMQIAENTLKRKNEIDKPATAVANLGAATKMQTAELLLNHKDEINNSMTAVGHLEIARENDSMNESVSAASKFPSSLEMESSMGKLLFSVQPFETFLQPDDLTSKAMATAQQQCSIADETMDKSLCSVQRLQTSSLTTINKSLSDSIDTKTKSKSDTVDDRRAFSKSKTSRSSSSVKKGKSSSYSMTVNKPQVMANKSHLPPYKPKRLLEGSSNDRFEAVQEKLNELLDADGGISKRKDAAKGYLKLLLLTAASGDSSNGEAIQSNRDLSMILDALLKTKSRLVLFDIINKNGLQMLHNIMKCYRSDFIKIPILRKLLKVLEYLAVREILTLEQINGGPPCPGVESFRESILTLTEHDDKQVHQIARNFRDKWIPRPVRKISCMERDNGRMEFHRGSNFNGFLASHDHWRAHSVRLTEAIDCVKQSTLATLVGSDTQEGLPTSCSSGCATNGTKTRKRKSRWDQPAETNTPRSPRHKESKIQPSLIQKSYSNPQPEIGEVVLDHISSMSKDARGGKNSPGCMHNFSQQIESRANEGGQNIDEDVPPGFLPPRSGPLVSSNASTIDLHGEKVNKAECSCKVVMGHPQERFISRLSVSYGVPLSVMQQFGTPKADIVDGWFIAPGVPFDPFPPLPPYPREKGDPSTCDTHHITTNQRAEKVEHDGWNPATHLSNQETPSTSGSSTPDMMGIPRVNIQHNFQRARGPSFSLGGRYFRQQKWNNSKLGPPWIRKRNGWGSMGNNLRSGMCGIGIGSVANELKGLYNSAHVGTRVESACNYFYQDPHHQYQH